MTNADKLYYRAKSQLLKNLAPGNETLGCAISFSSVYNQAFPCEPDIRFVNTTQCYEWMKSSPKWTQLDKPEANCVIVSVTGLIPKNSPLDHGHIGIVGRINSADGTPYIMSNDSNAGYWNTQFTLKKWEDYFIKYGKVPTFYFMRNEL